MPAAIVPVAEFVCASARPRRADRARPRHAFALPVGSRPSPWYCRGFPSGPSLTHFRATSPPTPSARRFGGCRRGGRGGAFGPASARGGPNRASRASARLLIGIYTVRCLNTSTNNLLISLVPQEGFEPTTPSLRMMDRGFPGIGRGPHAPTNSNESVASS
jgi:hypothetical protein